MGQTMVLCGMAAALLTLLLFAAGWVLSVRRSEQRGAGVWLNGIGYGLLPALAVGKAFQQYTVLGAGISVMEPITASRWLTPEGVFAPCRIEILLLFAGFAGITVWLIRRKKDLSEKGDLLLISVSVFSALRALTESIRAETLTMWNGHRLMRYLFCLILLICMIVWTVRQRGYLRNSQLWISWVVFIAATAVLLFTGSGMLTVGSRIGDLAVITGCAIALLAAVLTAGGESRLIPPQARQTE